MCGIAGKVYFSNQVVNHKDLDLMSNKISHRGPDDEGFYISNDKKVSLVSRRLAIIDLSLKGHQPMTYKNRYWITFNGEIYNFQEEKTKLKRYKIRFKSNSDTEVLLALYHKYGVKCLEHLRGMFAFAIFDSEKNTIFLARDRVGKKPLKYYFDGNVFIFASELKAILTQKEVKAEPDFLAIHNFLTYGYVPAPDTGFKDIKKLEPGNYLFIDISKKEITKKRYWKLDFSKELSLSEDEWKEKILTGLEEATKLRLIADVPVGVFLSGGLDSSLVVAMMSKLSSTPVKTFTIGFEDNRFDESKYAEEVSKLFDTDNHKFIVKPESIESLPDLVGHFEEPFADNSLIVTCLISELAKKYVTVALNGDGGDENFAGYTRYNRLKRDVFVNKFKVISPLATPLLKILHSSTGVSFLKRGYRFLKKSNQDLVERYLSYFGFFTNEEKENLYSKYFKDLTNNHDSLEFYRQQVNEVKDIDPCNQILYADINSYLPEDLLVKVDLASMRVGLEGRSPFIDHKFMEMTSQIPFKLKLKGNINKYILKKSLEGIIPEKLIYRQKVGFTIPLGNWFTGKFNQYAKSKLFKKGSITQTFFDHLYIKQLLSTHTEKNDFGVKLWTLLILELWFEEYFSK